jgi:hypothetical protein
MTPDGARWARLERYARWRARRFPLDRLPGDVLALLLTDFLGGEDACRVLDALYGVPERGAAALAPRVLARVPAEVRAAFALHHMREGVRAMLYGLANGCLHVARRAVRVHAFLDWSPFASVGTGTIPCPVAEYRWQEAAPFAVVALDEGAIERAVRRHVRAGLPCATVALYRAVSEAWATVLVPTPLLVFVHPLCPAATLASDCGGG